MPAGGPSRRRLIWVGAGVVVLAAATFVIVLVNRPAVAGLSALAKRDASGATACKADIDYANGTFLDPQTHMRTSHFLFTAYIGMLAEKSATAGIRSVAKPVTDARLAGYIDTTGTGLAQPYVADPDALWVQCAAAGLRMPAHETTG